VKQWRFSFKFLVHQGHSATGELNRWGKNQIIMKQIYITCTNCGCRFKGAMSTPGVIMRIEAPCPNCTYQNKTPYGLVTPFANQLFYLDQNSEKPSILRKTIAEELGEQDPQGELPATAAEVINAY
jgi:hypothetical protein